MPDPDLFGKFFKAQKARAQRMKPASQARPTSTLFPVFMTWIFCSHQRPDQPVAAGVAAAATCSQLTEKTTFEFRATFFVGKIFEFLAPKFCASARTPFFLWSWKLRQSGVDNGQYTEKKRYCEWSEAFAQRNDFILKSCPTDCFDRNVFAVP
jgi:hypothetical protein